MNNAHIHVIPAEAGYFVVLDVKEDKELAIGAAVIAWRFKTALPNAAADFVSTCAPLTTEGDAASNCIGILQPDKKVTVFNGATYASMSEAQSARYENTSYGTPNYTA